MNNTNLLAILQMNMNDGGEWNMKDIYANDEKLSWGLKTSRSSRQPPFVPLPNFSWKVARPRIVNDLSLSFLFLGSHGYFKSHSCQSPNVTSSLVTWIGSQSERVIYIWCQMSLLAPGGEPLLSRSLSSSHLLTRLSFAFWALFQFPSGYINVS